MIGHNHAVFLIMLSLFMSDESICSPFITTGVLDRIEDGQAVILMEEWHDELVVPEQTLPAESDVNTWFSVLSVCRDSTILGIDYKKTAYERKNVEELLDRLRKTH